MAPKGPRRVEGSFVKTTKKVVEETLTVSILGNEGSSQEAFASVDGSQEATPVKYTKVVEVVVEEKETTEEETSCEKHEEAKETSPPTEEEAAGDKQGEARESGPTTEEEETIGDEQELDKETESPTEEPEQPLKADEEGGEKEKKIEGEGGRRRKRRRVGRRGGGGGGGVGEASYKRYVFRVLKQVHPGMGVSSRAMEVLDALMCDMFERLAEEAARLSRYTGKATLSSREIQDAARLVLPGQLGKHAIAEGTKAVTNYMTAERDAAQASK